MTGIVIAHGKVADGALRNGRTWKGWFDRLEWVAPEDDPLPWDCLTAGTSCKEGPGTVERMRLAASLAARHGTAAVLEYDTLTFGPPPVTEDGTVWCSVTFPSEDPRFTSPLYGHSPWVTDRGGWAAMADAGFHEHGFPDRWLAAAALAAGLGLRGLPHSYSRHTVGTGWQVEEALAALRGGDGPRCVHGVKDDWVFEALSDHGPYGHPRNA